jgi:tRNA uridine 5-carboxymethylaminomethyl modification enzyme
MPGSMNDLRFDVLVIGGGHAGAEAAWAAAHLGARTGLVTFQVAAIGRMSCNPAIGGIGKGQMVREIDALGGLMGLTADETGIQFRILNRRKGAAMWAPRCQSDSAEYARAVQRRLASCPNLTLIEGSVETLDSEPLEPARAPEPWRHPQIVRRITGVTLADGRRVQAPAVVVTSGTFLAAQMHTGEQTTPGGRVGEPAAVGLSAALRGLGLQLGRLKTGTPPRLDRETVDFGQLEAQQGDDPPQPFSFMNDALPQSQVQCWITYTNEQSHAAIRENLHRAPMYSGQIQAGGPRYCPSIEDKVVRFADKSRHQIFLEPEGRDSQRIYCNGISTSLPVDVQRRVLDLTPGLEKSKVLQWGYAVEYDFVPPEQIDSALMTKPAAGLFLAGQINGTSGYEEAAGQGLLAGLNAARYVAGGEPVVLGRHEAYIGVMIDDLVTRGVVEPYRMFTSRAEHRLQLRHDNADTRLTPLGRRLGLVDDARWRRYEQRQAACRRLRDTLDRARVDGRSLADWCRRPDAEVESLAGGVSELAATDFGGDVWASVTTDLRYSGYLEREARVIERRRETESALIPADFDYGRLPHLRREARERWTAVRPRTLGQAGRVSGIHPSDVALLMVALSRRTADTR